MREEGVCEGEDGCVCEGEGGCVSEEECELRQRVFMREEGG